MRELELIDYDTENIIRVAKAVNRVFNKIGKYTELITNMWV